MNAGYQLTLCLSEGVDVPSLDAVMFLPGKNSQIDVVQSVGRVMRRSEGKKYGYIIIPVIFPSDIAPEEALNDNERYKVVWTVLTLSGRTMTGLTLRLTKLN